MWLSIQFFLGNEFVFFLSVVPIVWGYVKVIQKARKANSNRQMTPAEERNYNNSIKVLSGILAVIGIFLIVLLSLNYFDMQQRTKVPKVTDLYYGNAETILNAAELEVQTLVDGVAAEEDLGHDDYYYHRVREQDPASGTIVPKWATVAVSIQSAPEEEEIPEDAEPEESVSSEEESEPPPEPEESEESAEEVDLPVADVETSSSAQQQPNTEQAPAAAVEPVEPQNKPYESTQWFRDIYGGHLQKYNSWPSPFPVSTYLTLDYWINYSCSKRETSNEFIRITGLYMLPSGPKDDIPINLNGDLYNRVRNSSYPVLLATYDWGGVMGENTISRFTHITAYLDDRMIDRGYYENGIYLAGNQSLSTSEFWYFEDGILIHELKESLPVTNDMVYIMQFSNFYNSFSIFFPLEVDQSGEVRLLRDVLGQGYLP